jgi:hypothetical protein
VALEPADAVICLYDVVGTYPDNEQNARLLANVSEHVRPGGYALISVMNYERTECHAKHRFVLDRDPDALLQLAAGDVMETTGDVFDPNCYLVDVSTQVIYRREQFQLGGALPVELIVRDRRFRKDEIEQMCQSVGFEVVWSRCVRSGDWETALDCRELNAKEILVLCRKPHGVTP